ncbi:MAG: RHS repeat-associated core domain-containing protein, partial [Vicinamibacterales bacterium]
ILPDGQYQNVLYGNGVSEQFLREPDGRRQLFEWSATTTSGFYRFNNWFDSAGRVDHERQEQPSAVADLSYQYDGLGRLAQSLQLGGANDGLEWFAHDPLGNLTWRLATTTAGSRVYTIDPADPDRLCRYAPMGTPGPCQFTYDAAGNVIEDTTQGEGVLERRKLTYDSGQRLTAIQRGLVTAAFTYGPLGRIGTSVLGPAPRQAWTFGDLMALRARADGKVQLERRIPGPLGVVASLRHDGTEQTVVYTHGDGRGNRFFTDGTGHVVQETTYGPYGRVTSDSGAATPLTYTDDLWNGGDDLRELGVVLLGPRAYDPEIGRFLQRDPLIHTGSGSTGNPYSFAFGDPVNLSDPTGLSPGEKLNKLMSKFSNAYGVGVVGLGLLVSLAQSDIGPSTPQAPVAVPLTVPSWLTSPQNGSSAGGGSSWTSRARGIARWSPLGISLRQSRAGLRLVSSTVTGTAKAAQRQGACIMSGQVSCWYDDARAVSGSVASLVERVWDDPVGTGYQAVGTGYQAVCPGGDCVEGTTQLGLLGVGLRAAPGDGVEMVNPAALRWTQRTAGGSGRAATLRESMAARGYAGDPIDVVRTADGLVTVDHTRAAVALELGIESIPARVHLAGDALPTSMAGRFGSATTWGEAAAFRAAGQRPPLPPTGTPTPPRLPRR